MRHSDSLASLAPALVDAQAALKAVTKDSTNPDFRSFYASLDAIIDHVRPVLAKHGLAVVQGAASPAVDETGALAGFAVETMLVHRSGEWVANTAIMPVVGRMKKGGELGEVTPQQAGSALTYGRRYGLAALLALATEEDDDGNAASAPRPAAHRQAAPATGAPAASASDDPPCPKCAGRMWDNRATKTNPKQPDFRCRNKPACDGVIWPAKEA